DEWKKKVMEVEKEKSQSLTSTNGSPHPVKKVQKNFKNNYASVECGAKILSANSEAKSTSAILMENMDIYMLNPCSTKIWFVIELCEPIQVKQLDIANFELFSSTPKDFLVSISDRYPTNKWIKLGTFHARDERTVQSFPLDEQLYAKYVKVELQSHFGSEHFCPLSLFRVFGTSMVEEIDELADPYPPGRVDDPDEEYDFLPGYLPSEDQSSKNLLGSATSTYTHYMYRKQMEEMQRAFNKTIIKLQNTSRIAEEQDQKQTESIQALQTQLENVTRIMLNLSATVVQLKREVSDRQSYLVVSLFLCVLLALLLCVQCCRSSSNHSSTTSPVVPMSNHYPSPKRCFSSYDDMSLQRKVPCPLVRSKSFQLPSSDVGPDDLFIVEPLRFSPEKKKKRCKMRAVETLKPSVPVTTTVSNDTPKCNGVYEIMGFLQSPDGDLSTSSSKDTATSEVSSEGSSTLSDESHCHSLCNGQVPRPSGRSRAEKRSFKRRQSKMAEQLIHYEDQLLHAPVSMTTGTVEGRQELGVGVGTFRVPTVTGHV
uniref:SUN domain-containing protein n=1 Tax=Denticeps clupeoides TaxID=299321 RepID=A0AAY4D5J0_9TELE